MWRFLKDVKYLIVSIIAIIIDGVIVYFIPSYFNNLNLFYPMFTISLIPFLYCNNSKKYYYTIFILGVFYDILYTDIFLYNAILFLILGIINVTIIKYFKNSLFLLLILTFINIIMYDSISFVLVILTNYQNIIIYDLFYKISHSLIVNIMSVFVYFFLFKKRRKCT